MKPDKVARDTWQWHEIAKMIGGAMVHENNHIILTRLDVLVSL